MYLLKKQTAIFFLVFILIFTNSLAAQIPDDEPTKSIYHLDPGTKISVQMNVEINSEAFSKDDTFLVNVIKPVVVKNTAVLPAGTKIEGRITKVDRASTGKNGKLDVVFEKMIFESGETRNIEAVLVNKIEAESSSTKNILIIIGGTAIGGLIGALSKSENGALIGAGIGAGAGTGTALLKKGSDVRIKTDEKFEIELVKSVVLPVQGF